MITFSMTVLVFPGLGLVFLVALLGAGMFLSGMEGLVAGITRVRWTVVKQLAA